MARLLNENALSFNSEKGYLTVAASAKGTGDQEVITNVAKTLF